jgi:hypothetical protein
LQLRILGFYQRGKFYEDWKFKEKNW